jgi:DNA-binding GntR family transcriptional regulator
MITVSSSKNKLSDQIFITLRDRIVYLDYPPETVLSEKELCGEFSVSRTPLREAILKLEEMNLVQSIPRFGTYVTHIDTKEIRSTYEVKINLEMLAGSLASQRITEEELRDLERLSHEELQAFSNGSLKNMFDCDFRFHEAVWRASRNEVLEKMLTNLHPRCLRFCIATIPASDWEKHNPLEFHKIFEAIKNRDEKKTASLMAAHNQQYIELIKASSF